MPVSFKDSARAEEARVKLNQVRDDILWLDSNHRSHAINIGMNAAASSNAGHRMVNLAHYPHWKEGLKLMIRQFMEQQEQALEKLLTELGFEVPPRTWEVTADGFVKNIYVDNQFDPDDAIEVRLADLLK